MHSPILGEFMGTLALILLGDGVVANVLLRRSKAEGVRSRSNRRDFPRESRIACVPLIADMWRAANSNTHDAAIVCAFRECSESANT